MYQKAKVIDAHVHPISFLFQDDLSNDCVTKYKSVETILKCMDRHGIDQAVGMISQNMSDLPLENDLSVKLAKEMPERFPAVLVGFSQIKDETWRFDGNKVAEELDRYLSIPEVKGMGEMSLGAIGGFGEWSEVWSELRPVFEVLSAHHALTLFHTGPTPVRRNSVPGNRRIAGRALYWANPIFLDDIASEYPEVPIIIGHSGVQGYFFYGSYADIALMVAARHENVYLETSSAPYEVLEKAVMDPCLGGEKLIFGTDTPAYFTHYQAKNGEYYPTYGKNGPGDYMPDHYTFELPNIYRLPVSEQVRQMILGGTISKILEQKI